jgi:hypothetical protein
LSEDQLIAESAAAARAHQVLDYLKPLLDQVRAELQRQWFDTRPAEAAKRENLWRELHCLDAIEAKITAVIETGKLARASLERKAKRNL